MNFKFSEEQNQIKETLNRLLKDRYTFSQRITYSREEKGFSEEIWASYAELGFLGIGFAEEDGGFDGGPVETMIVAERLGAHLVMEPWIETVVTAGGFLRRAADRHQRALRIPALIGGEYRMSFAQAERQSRYDLHDVATTAVPSGDGWVLNGEKIMVLNADAVDEFIVTARIAGERREREGITLFLVRADAPGVAIMPYGRMDGRRAANVHFDNVGVSAACVLGDPGAALPLVEAVVDETLAAQAAEAVGSMQAALDLTVEYLKTRKQFGRAIGSFQSLQHRASEMMVAVEQTRSMSLLAAMSAHEEDSASRRRGISATKVEVCRNGRFVGEQAVQLHGGIGMTMEYTVGHHLRHLKVIEATYGDYDHHLQMLMKAGGVLEI